MNNQVGGVCRDVIGEQPLISIEEVVDEGIGKKANHQLSKRSISKIWQYQVDNQSQKYEEGRNKHENWVHIVQCSVFLNYWC